VGESAGAGATRPAFMQADALPESIWGIVKTAEDARSNKIVSFILRIRLGHRSRPRSLDFGCRPSSILKRPTEISETLSAREDLDSMAGQAGEVYPNSGNHFINQKNQQYS